MTGYDRLGSLVPDGYRVVETPRIVKGSYAEFYPVGWLARRRAATLNERAGSELYRYEAARDAPGLGLPTNWITMPRWPRSRWVVVARQNVLRKTDDETPDERTP